MDLSKDELIVTKARQIIKESKDVPIETYKELYEETCEYMSSYNREVERNNKLEKLLVEQDKLLKEYKELAEASIKE